MSNLIKKLLGMSSGGSKGMSRRDFLRKTGAGAALAATSPPLKGAADAAGAAAQKTFPVVTDPRVLAGMDSPQGKIFADGLGSVTPEWTWTEEYGLLTAEQLRALQKELKVANTFARIQNPPIGSVWNPVTRGFHQEKVLPTDDPNVYVTKYLEKGAVDPSLSGSIDNDLEFGQGDWEYWHELQQNSVDKGIIPEMEQEWAKWQREVMAANSTANDPEARKHARKAREQMVDAGYRLGSHRQETSPLRDLPVMERGGLPLETMPDEAPNRREGRRQIPGRRNPQRLLTAGLTGMMGAQQGLLQGLNDE